MFNLEVSVYVSGQTRKSHSGGRRFDPDQLHQNPSVAYETGSGFRAALFGV
jgi:hypothetical protein